MGIALSELFMQLNDRGLCFRRSPSGDIEVAGDIGQLSDVLRQGIAEHRTTILSCLPTSAPAAAESGAAVVPTVPSPAATANTIRNMIEKFGLWLGQNAPWALPQYVSDIDRQLAEAVDTQSVQQVEARIEALMSQVEGHNWACEILPRSFETEAKHAAEFDAGSAEDSAEPDDIPF